MSLVVGVGDGRWSRQLSLGGPQRGSIFQLDATVIATVAGIVEELIIVIDDEGEKRRWPTPAESAASTRLLDVAQGATASRSKVTNAWPWR